jgi:hypothetical protein
MQHCSNVGEPKVWVGRGGRGRESTKDQRGVRWILYSFLLGGISPEHVELVQYCRGAAAAGGGLRGGRGDTPRVRCRTCLPPTVRGGATHSSFIILTVAYDRNSRRLGLDPAVTCVQGSRAHTQWRPREEGEESVGEHPLGMSRHPTPHQPRKSRHSAMEARRIAGARHLIWFHTNTPPHNDNLSCHTLTLL